MEGWLQKVVLILNPAVFELRTSWFKVGSKYHSTIPMLFTYISNIVDARKNDITPSNIMEMKTDVSKVLKWCQNGAR